MSDRVDVVYAKMKDRYERGATPWDSELPPPEVLAFVAEAKAGRALDLGCGYGRAAIYLAQHGWEVDGVDIVELAVEGARERAADMGVSPRFHCHSITDLSFLEPPYDYAIDVGCAHNLTAALWAIHHAELKRLMGVGGLYMLYGRTLGEKGWGFNEAELLPLMEDGFVLERRELGMTHMDDGASWGSVWYWFRRV